MNVVQVRSESKLKEIDFSLIPFFEMARYIDSPDKAPRTLICAIENGKALGVAAILVEHNNSIGVSLQVAKDQPHSEMVASLLLVSLTEWLAAIPKGSFRIRAG